MIIAYIVLFALVALAITSIPITLIGGLLARLLNLPILYAALIGGLIVWFFLNYIWFNVAGQDIPVLAFAICFLILGFHSSVSKKELNEQAKLMIGGEQWAIVLICLFTVITSEVTNWI